MRINNLGVLRYLSNSCVLSYRSGFRYLFKSAVISTPNKFYSDELLQYIKRWG